MPDNFGASHAWPFWQKFGSILLLTRDRMTDQDIFDSIDRIQFTLSEKQ